MKKNVGEIFTIEREGHGGTGYGYYVTKLDSGLALVGTDVVALQPHLCGGSVKYVFSFVGLKPGKATFQLALFRPFDISSILYEEEVTVDVQSSIENADNANMDGGWSKQGPLTPEDRAVFDEAMKGWVGVGYKPISVAKQVVAGMKYRFICDATPACLDPKPYKAMVEIFLPVQGKPVITDIVRFLGAE